MYGSRQMARHLRRNGWCVGRQRVRRLMSKMGLAPIYQRPKTSAPHPTHRICLPASPSDHRPTEPGLGADVTYIPMREASCTWSRSWTGSAARFWRGGCRTRWMLTSVSRRWRRRSSASAARDLQHGSGFAVHQLCLHQHLEGCRHRISMTSWPLDGQRLHRAAVAITEIRMRLPQCLHTAVRQKPDRVIGYYNAERPHSPSPTPTI